MTPAPVPAEPPRQDGWDRLIVSGGGTTLVATDELLAEAAMLRLVHSQATSWLVQLERIRLLGSTPSPGWTAGDPGLGTFAVTLTVDDVQAHSGALADALVASAEEYGLAERRIAMLGRLSAGALSYALGRIAPFLAFLAVPALSSAALGWLLGSFVSRAPPGAAPAAVADGVLRDPRVLSNPIFVAAVRALVSSADDAAAGVLAVPFPVSFALGEDGADIFGAASSAAGVLVLARSTGMLRETAVTVRQVGAESRSKPPAGLGDLARRIPNASTAGPQVRIERYGSAASPRWVVYVGGTADWSPVSGKQPWDMTSNVTSMAEQGSGSYRAVEQAMRQAGVRPTDPVVGVGHSQGGLIVAQVAASGKFNTVAVATFGAPAGQVAVPDTVPMIAAEHADDVVPALGGPARNATGTGNQHLVVRREVYADRDVPPGQALPAHSMSNYRDTARLIDASSEPRLVEFRGRIAEALGSEPGHATSWRGVRKPPSGRSG
jgi:predicted esterase